ncbi:MAG: phosphatase PAP2 family protein [Actinomycetota bacterium]
MTKEPAQGGIAPPPGTPAPQTQGDWRDLLRAVVGESAAVDVAVYDAVAATRTPTLDRTMSASSDAANRSVLWFAIAGALAIAGGRRGRLAARDGVMAIGMASATVNLGLKHIATRKRPLRDEVAQAQARRVRMPSSNSFPSGHTASAFAFATAVGQRIPSLWLPLRGLALLIGYSRIHTGVHYPGDVVAGAAVGSACGWTVANAAKTVGAGR